MLIETSSRIILADDAVGHDVLESLCQDKDGRWWVRGRTHRPVVSWRIAIEEWSATTSWRTPGSPDEGGYRGDLVATTRVQVVAKWLCGLGEPVFAPFSGVTPEAIGPKEVLIAKWEAAETMGYEAHRDKKKELAGTSPPTHKWVETREEAVRVEHGQFFLVFPKDTDEDVLLNAALERGWDI